MKEQKINFCKDGSLTIPTAAFTKYSLLLGGKNFLVLHGKAPLL